MSAHISLVIQSDMPCLLTLVDWVKAGHTTATGAMTMRATKNANAKSANTYHLMFSVCV